jgi:stage V sporulation protein AD
MTESLAIGSMLIDGGFAENILCATSSHFATAERQFRFPLELGTPKPPTGQDTVTGAGATILSTDKSKMCVTAATIGRVIDFGIPDANNMGAAMAPAAVETILTHLEKRGASPSDFDVIVTGDLGIFGSEMLIDLAGRCGVHLESVHQDCGKLIFAGMKNKHCGASGCGCCASVLNGYFLKRMVKGEYRRLLVIATGALMSTTSVQQGESIPCIAHAVEIERRDD